MTAFSRRKALISLSSSTLAFGALSACSSGTMGSLVGAALNSGLVQAPTFEVQGFGVQSLGLQSQVLQVDTKVTNPNGMQLTINNVDLSVMLAGIDLGKATAQESFVIPANSSVVVPLTVNVNMVGVLNQSVGLLNVRLDTPLPYALNGSVNVSQMGIPVPVNIQGTVTPNQIIGMAQFLGQVAGPAAGLVTGGAPSTNGGNAVGSIVGSVLQGLLQ